MKTIKRTLIQVPVFYRVKVPVRGVTEGDHKAVMFPRGTLLERLPQDESTRVPVRWHGHHYSVPEPELTQNCERVVGRTPAGATTAQMLSHCLSYLKENRISYLHSIHESVKGAHGFTSPDGIPLCNLAFTVVYHGNNRYGMLVLPADRVAKFWTALDFGEVRKLLDLRQIRLAGERELASLFPECEINAVPPLGRLFDMPVLLEQDLAAMELMTFNISTSRDVVRIRITDFLRLASPGIGSFTAKRPVVQANPVY